MVSIKEDLWNCKKIGSIVVPINMGLVCGRGVAAQWATLYPDEYTLAKENKNLILKKFFDEKEVAEESCGLLLFFYGIVKIYKTFLAPVKYHWTEKASIKLIERFLIKMKKYSTDHEDDLIFIPLLGCGFGELSEDDVLPLMKKYFTKRMVLVYPPDNLKDKYDFSFRSSRRKDWRFTG
ncbi:MAG: hypothetical protein N3A54_00115 [Patescibacteria group bacterium]|nr:hypothetical protein [Patescibacteria group bacterium]